MATYTKRLLSGSTNGKGIKVAATGTPGTLIHTAVTGTDNLDEIWLYAENNGSALATLTIEYGGVASPDDHIEMTLENGVGLYTVLPGLLLQNSLVVRAYASAANVIIIQGFVNRITA